MSTIKKTWDFETEGPSLEGKVIFVTGGTAGLGATTVERFAIKGPSHIYFSGRNATAAATVIEKVRTIAPAVAVTFVELDQSSFASVAQAIARTFHSDRLDILVCNAGIMAVPKALSKDGYEIQFGVNHLGHALITRKLLSTLLRTAERGHDVRIVFLTSAGWRGHPRGGIQLEKVKSTQDFPVLGPWLRYSQSKLANILYAAELARRYPQLTVVSVHPGVIETGLVTAQGLFNKFMIYVPNMLSMISHEDGTLNTTWAATVDKTQIENGAVYYPVGTNAQDKLDRDGRDTVLAGKLWDYTEDALAPFLAPE